ncbi:MAG: hypothetical protein M1343_07240 [Chloroflexi bacterium]|nr:hypothetical protein [Chloroflexota bacterium]
MHPGRAWANRLTGAPLSRENVIVQVNQALAELPFP